MSAASTGPESRLDSWKEIAAYLKRGVRTVQRWEQSNGLPVHRLELKKQGTVYAYKAELDAWWHSRQPVETATRVEVPSGKGSYSAVAPAESDRTPVWIRLALHYRALLSGAGRQLATAVSHFWSQDR